MSTERNGDLRAGDATGTYAPFILRIFIPNPPIGDGFDEAPMATS